MLSWLEQLTDVFGPFRVFGSIFFRTAAALITAVIITWFAYPSFIAWLTRVKAGQAIREDGPQAHLQKAGTPTMGGLLMLVAIVVASVLWARPEVPWVWAVVLIALGFGLVGFVDDFQKVARKSSAGLSGKARLAMEFAIAGAVMTWLMLDGQLSTAVPLPFFKGEQLELGWGYVAFSAFVIVAFANAVNLTDGLDGLAIGPVIIAAGTFLILSYGAGTVLGGFNIAKYLNIPHIPGSSELAVYCAAMVGAGTGFLWYNTYPATVFMGDVGSLSLGGGLGMLAVLTKNEFVWVVLGGIFVLETVSVMVQVISFKLTGKRVFRMAPIHHHFELKGWAEPKVIVRFWIISIMLALFSLATLKLR